MEFISTIEIRNHSRYQTQWSENRKHEDFQFLSLRKSSIDQSVSIFFNNRQQQFGGIAIYNGKDTSRFLYHTVTFYHIKMHNDSNKTKFI